MECDRRRAAQVGPALFTSLLIITSPSFRCSRWKPGRRLFSPLAYTKTYAMAAAAGLAITLIPVLMGYLIRGRIPEEKKNPLNRPLIALYGRCSKACWPFQDHAGRRAADPAGERLSATTSARVHAR